LPRRAFFFLLCCAWCRAGGAASALLSAVPSCRAAGAAALDALPVPGLRERTRQRRRANSATKIRMIATSAATGARREDAAPRAGAHPLGYAIEVRTSLDRRQALHAAHVGRRRPQHDRAVACCPFSRRATTVRDREPSVQRVHEPWLLLRPGAETICARAWYRRRSSTS